ncbi:MAG: ATP-binding protein [Caldilineaceae bacterium]
MAEIVKALKTFTYLDQAPVQNVDIHAGLDNTLVILRNKLKQGVNVHRDYAADLPLIEARLGVEPGLDQHHRQRHPGHGRTRRSLPAHLVAGAVGGGGDRRQRPRHSRRDSAASVRSLLHHQAAGRGTGLGLNISHNIIVQKHGGTIGVESEPGKTVFRVKLPLHAPKQVEEA